MKIFIVYAHQEDTSFNHALKEEAVSVLKSTGHEVKVSDLYAMKFDPAADRKDFLKLSDPKNVNYLMEQKSASSGNGFKEDIVREQEKLRWADLLFLQFPVWWFSVPAILKGWFDRVLAAGVAWDFGGIYDKGLLRGKKAALSVTTGGPEILYQTQGAHKGTLLQILHPVTHGTLHFCGYDVLPPFIAWSVFQAGDEGRKKYLEDFRNYLKKLPAAEPYLSFGKNGTP